MSDEDKEVTLRLRRDEDGNLKPVEGVSPRLGIEVVARPITYGQSRDIEKWGHPIIEWTDEDKAKVLRENLVEPDEFADVTVEELYRDFEAFQVEDIVQAIAFMSGYGRFFEEDEEAGKDPQDLGI